MAIFNRIANLFRRSHVDREIDAELQAHIALRIDDNIAAGMSPGEARRDALLRFGNPTSTREHVTSADAALGLHSVLSDIRFALRQLRRSPGFTAVVLITLALGIGANTAIFSLINAVMLTALPVQDPNRLVVLNWTSRNPPKVGHSSYGDCGGDTDCSVSVPFFETLRSQATSFAGMAAFAGPMQVDFSGSGPASIAQGEFVSGDYFSMLGLTTVLGRPLGPADDTPSAPPAIVLDYRFWQRAFAANPSVIGHTVRLNNIEAVVAGVADPRFTGLTPGKTEDFLMPLSMARQVRGEWWGPKDRLVDPTTWWVLVVARLKPGVSIAQAQSQASSLFRAETLRGARPMLTEADSPAIHFAPAREALNNQTGEIAPTLSIIMVAVAFILLIACANVAGLILARSAKRQKEMALRQALGARRGRITRQLLTESLLLSVAGGALGILVALWGVRAVAALLSNGVDQPFPFVVSPDWRVLAFTTAVTLLTGLLAGLAPTLRTTRLDLTPVLRENASSRPGGAARSGRAIRLGDSLVVAQVALSIVVLIGAGLLVRSLRNLHSINPGFDTRNLLLFGINPQFAGYQDRQTADLYRDLQQRFAALPGVLSVSYSENALLSQNFSGEDVHLDNAAPRANVNTDVLPVGLDFFSAMRIPVLSGRSFTPSDVSSATETHAAEAAADAQAAKQPLATAQPAPSIAAQKAAPVPVLVNQSFARKYFPNQNPVGLHIGNAQNDPPDPGPKPGFRIVGVVADAKYDDLRRAVSPTMYMPLTAHQAYFELRTSGDPTALINSVRQVVAAADSNLPIFEVRTQTEQVEQTLVHERLLSRLSSFFALLALVLACVGLYGLLSFEVAQRTRELGIRMALGARRFDLMRLVVRQGLLLVLAGAVIGIGTAIGVTRFMASMLYDVHPSDPATFVAVAVLLLLVAVAASFIPARRAASIDPMQALRSE